MRTRVLTGAAALVAAGLLAGRSMAEDGLRPGEVAAYPTWHAVGLEIAYQGDDDADGSAEMHFRPAGEEKWRPGVEMTRDVKRRLWWASVYPLEPGREIEIMITFADTDVNIFTWMRWIGVLWLQNWPLICPESQFMMILCPPPALSSICASGL